MFTLLANLGGSPLGESCGFWGADGYPLKQAAGTRTEIVPCVLQRSRLGQYRRPTRNVGGRIRYLTFITPFLLS
jgi:5-aminopentanamidase